MRWYKYLYIGEKASRHQYKIIQKVENAEFQIDTYIITPASGEKNILDIYPSSVLLQPHYQQMDLLILGIAIGYQEAVCVAAKIIDQMYKETGDFKLDAFITT